MSSLLDLVASSERYVNELSDGQKLRAAATRIVSVATSSGATHLLAASPAAERLVGAALLVSPGLRALMYAQADMDVIGQQVLVVDVNLASGTGIANAARRARQAGARRVAAAALHALPSAVGPDECGVDSLEIVES
ncbi:hypothetical protein [Micromonospora sp. WMMA1976]|uniref:hypothetical protein n=1 Tax=Micromonospora sp. WMMA1976 TaxID=3014995 RepID=UPI00248B3C0A|nr:hypothetical protein [Micromonospora sp. WMMA1976]WBC01126.1 hypothetical protein O7546_18345 [Micromonospora sp. WMMA1976]